MFISLCRVGHPGKDVAHLPGDECGDSEECVCVCVSPSPPPVQCSHSASIRLFSYSVPLVYIRDGRARAAYEYCMHVMTWHDSWYCFDETRVEV